MQGTFTVKAADILRTIGNAAVFAGDDKILPVLNAVRVEVSEPDGNAEATLTAVATDRYTIGIDTCEVIGVTTALNLLLALDDVTRILKAVKSIGRRFLANAFVVVTVHEDQRVTVDVANETSITVRQVDGEFPKYRSLWPDTTPARTDYDTIGFNPAMLARFAKVDGGSRISTMTVTLGETAGKPVTVTIGDTFRGLQMPVRLAG